MSSLTVHECELRNAYWRDRAHGMDPEEVEHCLGLFYSGPGQTWVADFLTQSHAAWSIYDAYALHTLLSWWIDGLVSFAHVSVGATPTWDRFVEENNARLAHLPAGFRATFAPTGGFGYCDDGHFEWVEPLRLRQRSGDGTADLIAQPGSVPLEVGHTKASRTILHIICDGGLARWPYSANCVALCVVTEAGYRAFSSNDDRRRPRAQTELSSALNAVHSTRRPDDLAAACADLGLTGTDAAGGGR